MAIALLESAVDESVNVVGSWEPPSWVTDIDTTGNAAACYGRDIGMVSKRIVRIFQDDEITATPSTITISRREPVIQFEDAHLSVAEAQRLVCLLTTAIDTIAGLATS